MNKSLLFKYRPINKYTISSLVNSELYFASPGSLNDPFDCNLNTLKSLDFAISKATGETKARLAKLRKADKLFETIQNMVSRSGVCSFSIDLMNPLLWSHYSDDHRGLCLVYEIPENFIESGASKIAGMANVICEENSLTEWFLNVPEKLVASGVVAFGTELTKKLLTYKAPCWSYENEVRILRSQAGNIKIEKQFLKQVCFGLNTSEEDMKTIRIIVENNRYQVSFCRIIRSELDFGIGAEEI